MKRLFDVRRGAAVGLLSALSALAAPPAWPQSSLERLIAAPAARAEPVIPMVRKTLLAEAAARMGTQAGLADRAKEILRVIGARENSLDQRYRFQQLIIDAALLPPVIVQTHDAVSLDQSVMRVAKSVYRIIEPPRFVDVAPTWRDWLYLGLAGQEPPEASLDPEIAPKDAPERAFWEARLRAAYEQGVRQANLIFDANLATLDRAYDGMRTYFDLYARRMISAPVLSSTTDVATRDDENTLAVGSTIFRVVVNPRFEDAPKAWEPLGK